MRDGIQEIKLSEIKAHDLQPESRREIADLVASIKHVGDVLVPPIVMMYEDEDGTWDGYVALSGHRRIKAAKKAGRKTLHCDVWGPMVLAEQVKILTASNTQQELDAVQKGEILAKLTRERGMTFTQAYKAMGLSKVEARVLLRLADAPEKVRTAVRKRELSFGTFRRELASLNDNAMLEALSKGTTRRAIKRAKKKIKVAETPGRLLDDSEPILEALTEARGAIGKATTWLAGSEAAARAEVLEALRGLSEMLEDTL